MNMVYPTQGIGILMTAGLNLPKQGSLCYW